MEKSNFKTAIYLGKHIQNMNVDKPFRIGPFHVAWACHPLQPSPTVDIVSNRSINYTLWAGISDIGRWSRPPTVWDCDYFLFAFFVDLFDRSLILFFSLSLSAYVPQFVNQQQQQRISERAFDGLNNLRILNLQNNKIALLENGVFSTVPAVTTLNLNNNLLEWLTYTTVLPIMDNLVNNTASVLSISGEFSFFKFKPNLHIQVACFSSHLVECIYK